MQRHLAAVLAADVADYSRLMGEDAARTLSSLRRLRAELFGPAVSGHRGKLVKSMGDGWIVTFASAADAVTCAMRLQDKMAAEPDISLRIGIHIGDITHEDEDVFGEGVNVAARLEALTEPGGLTISDAAFAMLDGTLRPAFDDAGEQALKNIVRPVRLWTRGGVTTHAQFATPRRKVGFPKVQITPVTVTGDSDTLHGLASALTHDIETILVHVPWVQASVAVDPDPDSFVVRSVLRGSGDALRLEVRLIDLGGVPVWTSKYDGSRSDVFACQDATGADAASRVSSLILDHTTAQLSQKHPDAYTGEDWLNKAATQKVGTHAAMTTALGCLSNAIRVSPDLDFAYLQVLGAVAAASSSGYVDLVERYRPMLSEWAARATELSTGGASHQAILAIYRYVQSGDVAAAQADTAANLRNLPFDPDALLFTGYVFNFIGEGQNALECFTKFLDIARHHHFLGSALNGAGGACVLQGRYEQALAYLDAALRTAPGYIAAYRWKTAALAHLGRLDEARETLAQHDARLPGQTIAIVRAGSRYVETEATARYFDGLRLAGMPD